MKMEKVKTCLNNPIFSVAPMLKYTDQHFRYLIRLLSKKAILYTEMITTSSLIHGNINAILAYNNIEHPIALQLGGSNPKELAFCAKIGEELGYDEINLNIGCPSKKVQNHMFGACLMDSRNMVAECIDEMKNKISIPITIKHRIGLNQDSKYEKLFNFIKITSQAGCKKFIIHARNAILTGLSPKKNLIIPPLNYNIVYKIKQYFPQLMVILNGGLNNIKICKHHLKYVDGVMLGRSIYRNCYLMSEVDNYLYKSQENKKSRASISESYLDYMKEKQSNEPSGSLRLMSRHLPRLFYSIHGSKYLRQYIYNTPPDKLKIKEIKSILQRLITNL